MWRHSAAPSMLLAAATITCNGEPGTDVRYDVTVKAAVYITVLVYIVTLCHINMSNTSDAASVNTCFTGGGAGSDSWLPDTAGCRIQQTAGCQSRADNWVPGIQQTPLVSLVILISHSNGCTRMSPAWHLCMAR